ncbi:hypothetical protein DM860_018259 [Cuscuta australis]|uniref:glycerophosphodiester phosphodiesterase n=1 Tax=Cuscuta australis TaxID=267555 RepID=A0A328DB98_9ASTE|nr:hypothetical protein DM860_018259 [Cuscuta australis]
MCKLLPILSLLLFCSPVALVSARGSSNRTPKWKTLSGGPPIVIANGGFSGLFADSSSNAYAFAAMTSLPNVVMLCDLQLTKDGKGICFPNIKLNNASNVEVVLNDTKSGVPNQGLFCKDFNLKDLASVNLNQGVYSRSSRFDGTTQRILTVHDLFNPSILQFSPPGLWLNIQNNSFYSIYNLSMRSFVLSASRSVVIDYISSPEVSFLTSIATRINKKVTKLVFRFLGSDETEPSTNQTYGSLLNNLTFIKTFASGILVPKSYILPVDKSFYLQPYTSVVMDAHDLGLEVYASDFANDLPLPYDYHSDPLAEYLSYIDNGNFSVDGVLSDFPITPSAAIECYSHMKKDDKTQVPDLQIISFDGASGSYPGCTDIAYTSAVSDGVDIIDCNVQMSFDGKAFCLGSVNLIGVTTAVQVFNNLSRSIPELKTVEAIHSFDLTWREIQSLKPSISNPFIDFQLQRNPKDRNAGKFMTLEDFLAYAKNASSLSGVLISIENEAYLRKLGLSVTEAVLQALNNSGYANVTTPKVMIQSNDSATLRNITNKKYELVYRLKEDIRDIENSTISEIRSFASSVIISKKSVFPTDDQFLIEQTHVVAKMKEAKLKVYVQVFNNEFVSQAWDFFSDPYVELNSYIFGEAPIDGVITAFPATADKYRRCPCLGYKELPSYMLPVQPGSLFQLIPPTALPPAEAPNAILTESDVLQPALPPVSKVSPPPPPPPPSGSASAPPPKAPPSGQPSITTSGISAISMCILLLLSVLVIC